MTRVGSVQVVARAVVIGMVAAFVLLYFLAGQPFQNPYPGGDFEAYWSAAVRLREGGQLYPPVADAGAGDVYRYAPWFALAWVPLTNLPRDAVLAGWQIVLLLASAAILWPLVARRTLASALTAALMVPLCLDLIWVGNVEVLMVLVVAAALHRPVAGPLAIGLAASLKITPLAFAAVYVAERRWGRLALAIVATVLLWLPALPFGIAAYPTLPLSTIAIWGVSPVAGAAVAVVALAITGWLALRRSRWTLLAGAVCTLLASPRLYLTNVPRLLVAAWHWPEHP